MNDTIQRVKILAHSQVEHKQYKPERVVLSDITNRAVKIPAAKLIKIDHSSMNQRRKHQMELKVHSIFAKKIQRAFRSWKSRKLRDEKKAVQKVFWLTWGK